MASMSYCAFENTSNDLAQCVGILQAWMDENPGKSFADFVKSRSSRREQDSVNTLLGLCNEMVTLVDDMPEAE